MNKVRDTLDTMLLLLLIEHPLDSLSFPFSDEKQKAPAKKVDSLLFIVCGIGFFDFIIFSDFRILLQTCRYV